MKLLYILLLLLFLAGCGNSPGQPTATAIVTNTQTPTAAPTQTPTSSPTSTPTASPTPDLVMAGAGDIASCESEGDEATAILLEGIEGTVFTTGDNVYPDGSFDEYIDCYDPTWGRFKDRTFPSAGNHDYGTEAGEGYYRYFGPAAGNPGEGYYSYQLGTWHIIVLNSNLSVASGSTQEQWLRADLAAHTAVCTLAYWHHPRFSSGEVHGSNRDMGPLWQALYEYGADVVLNGHEHHYERFEPQNPDGLADPARGIRQFVVGTGGRSHYAFDAPIANSAVRETGTYGVLKLTLHSTSYSWEFVPELGQTFTDSGTAPCVEAGTAMAAPIDAQE